MFLILNELTLFYSQRSQHELAAVYSKLNFTGTSLRGRGTKALLPITQVMLPTTTIQIEKADRIVWNFCKFFSHTGNFLEFAELKFLSIRKIVIFFQMQQLDFMKCKATKTLTILSQLTSTVKMLFKVCSWLMALNWWHLHMAIFILEQIFNNISTFLQLVNLCRIGLLQNVKKFPKTKTYRNFVI